MMNDFALVYLMRRHKYTKLRLTTDQLKEIVSNGYNAIAFNEDNGDVTIELVQEPISYEAYKALKLGDSASSDTCSSDGACLIAGDFSGAQASGDTDNTTALAKCYTGRSSIEACTGESSVLEKGE